MEDGIPFHEVVNVYQALAVSLGQYAEDAAPLVNGTATAFPGAKIVHPSKVLNKLLAPSDNDQLLKELLQLLCTCFHTYMHNAWSAYLEGGCSTQVTVAETASLPKVNVISKRDFAQLDRFVREKPNATTLAIESVMLGNNRTVAWLAAKSTEE